MTSLMIASIGLGAVLLGGIVIAYLRPRKAPKRPEGPVRVSMAGPNIRVQTETLAHLERELGVGS